MICPNCGNVNIDGASFCGSCGTRLGAPAASVPPPAPSTTSHKNSMTIAYILIPVAVIAIIASLIIIFQNRPKANKFPPPSSIGAQQQSDESNQAKYFAADMQLSDSFNNKQTAQNLHQNNFNQGTLTTRFTTPYITGAIEPQATSWVRVQSNNPVFNYYQQYNTDPTVNLALNYVLGGDMVINIYQFDRIYLGVQGWQVVYGGSSTIADANDFVMASDIGGLNSEEPRIRYIIADIQLGDVAEYYRQFTDQPAVAEALRRWDAGTRVVNIQSFERVILYQAGWKVIRAGTQYTAQGMEIMLSTDVNISIPQPIGAPYDENWVRYILADSELGGVIEYYRYFNNQPEVVEAVCRWDKGIRVSNLYNYERSLNETIGWRVVSISSGDLTDGSSMQLNSDETCDSSGSTVAQSQWGACDNPYFPVIEGSWWQYSGGYNTIVTETDTLENVVTSNGYASFSIRSDSSASGTSVRNYTCNADGIYDADNGALLLPSSSLIYEGYGWYLPDGMMMQLHFMQFSSGYSPVGLVDMLQAIYVDQMHWDFYAYGIGPAGSGFGEGSWNLVAYYIPGLGQSDSAQSPQPASSSFGACNNPYFPVSPGSSWTYTGEFADHINNITKTRESSIAITNIQTSGSDTLIETMNLDNSPDSDCVTYNNCARPGYFACNADGVYSTYGGWDKSEWHMLLPRTDLLYPGYVFYDGEFPSTIGTATKTTPAGTFDTISVCTEFYDGSTCYYYTRGVGEVYYDYEGGGANGYTSLVSYSIQ
jgi:hypothetical protein